jgi:hypothetical protein
LIDVVGTGRRRYLAMAAVPACDAVSSILPVAPGRPDPPLAASGRHRSGLADIIEARMDREGDARASIRYAAGGMIGAGPSGGRFDLLQNTSQKKWRGRSPATGF